MYNLVGKVICASALIACTSGLSGEVYIPSVNLSADNNVMYDFSKQPMREFAALHPVNCSCGCCGG